MPKDPIKVAFADDQGPMLRGMESKLSMIPGTRHLFSALSGEILQQQLAQGELPDVLLLDIQFNQQVTGYSICEWLRDRYPAIAIIGHSGYAQKETVQKLLHSGACAFLEKGDGPKALEEALFDVMNHGYHLNEHVPTLAFLEEAQRLRVESPHQIKGVLKRVMYYCCTDRTYKEIGDALGTSERFAKKNAEILFKYFNVKTRTGLAMECVWHGLLPSSKEKFLQLMDEILPGGIGKDEVLFGRGQSPDHQEE